MKTNGVLEVVPFMSVVLTESAFLLGGDPLQNPEVRVLGNDGTLYQYYSFSQGRSSLVKIADTGIKTGPTLLKPYLNPLAHGKKIPVQMIDDILEFFRRVMRMVKTGGTGHGEYEAMAHIVWNPTTESYRVAIPKQTVSKSRVSYDWSHVQPGEEVILDIHSHNTMGAFYSGTDENDDKTYAGISGVAGQLDRATPQVIWRFNAYRTKMELSLEDIFALPEKSVSPEVGSWMNLVEVQTYTPPVTRPGSSVYGGGSRLNVGHDRSAQVREEAWGARFQGSYQDPLEAFCRSEGSEEVDHGNVILNSGLAWDETIERLAEEVWQEEDDEMNSEVIANLAARVVDSETLYQAGVFYVENSTDARKAIDRINKDFNVRSA